MALNQSPASDVNKSGEDAAAAALPSSRYHPTVWGNFFLAYEALEPFPEEETREHERLRKDIKMVLNKTPDESPLKLDLIDNIQRMGVCYQFKDEIEASLSNIENSYHESLHDENQDDLHTVALRFRLLRQQGYHVPSEVLKKFLKQEGEFEASLVKDVKGLLSLYEASHYRVRGENILEEALGFTKATLEAYLVNNSSEFIANKINQALKWPIRKTLNRITARAYISLYQQDESHDEVLLKFAILDFNRLQRLYQKELCALTKWWKDIDCPRNFPFVRDRMVENYLIMMAPYFEPEYSLGRKIVAKVLTVSTIIDDTFDDSNGTIDELRVLRDAVERWNMDVDEKLPPYMKLCHRAILELYTEMEQDLAKEGRSEWVQYAIEELKNYVKASYEEAYWSHTKHIPTLEKIKETGVQLTTAAMLTTSSLMGFGDLVNKDVLDWMTTQPSVVRAVSTVFQFIDDIYDYEETKHSTSVDCYMNQHGVSSEQAIDELQNQVSNAWKILNEECLLPTEMPLPIMVRISNFARLMLSMFQYGYDAYTHSETHTKQLITSIFVDPIPL